LGLHVRHRFLECLESKGIGNPGSDDQGGNATPKKASNKTAQANKTDHPGKTTGEAKGN
jgi:hypothetical protein